VERDSAADGVVGELGELVIRSDYTIGVLATPAAAAARIRDLICVEECENCEVTIGGLGKRRRGRL
jgi:hypothetical protein